MFFSDLVILLQIEVNVLCFMLREFLDYIED